ncbi:hypothetical protein CS0771_05200 [Catellatospora sp. IY07-71]|uniref:phospholipid carrier-dependent glycosyltransferase n=1 Tax=Catellatospora sp. IY07-71 TaxID=2728827 RepID=UPI001BB4270E|nr:phospholipid carrier-dependent glycosyltransferase [Catellatospora sp. IY07-71]BCJ70976.1 hypothetical protein CS0771_05200 [Catellatospora sp. IY07-71]
MVRSALLTAPASPTPERPLARAAWRGHLPVIVLVGLGVLVRVAACVAYRPAFWFQGDSGDYLGRAIDLDPHAAADKANTVGYAVFLAVLRWTDSPAAVAVAQHALGLAIAVLAYALLRRRGAAAWLSALGVAPLVLDARLLVLEHYILSDALFLVMITGAVVLLLWHERPGPAAVAGAGLLLGAAVLVRTAGIAAVAACLAFLAVRRIGWARAAAWAVGAALPLAAYAAWSVPATGSFSLSNAGDRYLYSRTAGIADCARLELTAPQRELCPAQPLGARPERGDWYLWHDPNLRGRGPEQDELIGSFARAVITQQPGDYAALVARDTARFLAPGRPVDTASRCLFGWWDFPATLPDPARNTARCKPLLAAATFTPEPVNPVRDEHAGLRAALAWYSRHVTVPPLVTGVCLLLCLAAPLRPRGAPARWDAALPAAIGLGLIVLSVATSMYEIRYGLTSIALLGVGGALAAHQLAAAVRAARATPPLPASGSDDS